MAKLGERCGEIQDTTGSLLRSLEFHSIATRSASINVLKVPAQGLLRC